MTLSQSERDDYRTRGFVLRKGFFELREIERIHEDAKRVFGLQMVRMGILPRGDVGTAEFETGMVALFERDLARFSNCGKQAQHLISLHRLSLDERLLGVLESLGLEFPNISTRPVLYFNARQLATKDVYWKLSVHQDWRSMQGSLDSVVVWVPLVDIDRRLGALEVIPGSHRWGLLPADMADGYGHLREPARGEPLVPVEVRRGDALFFSSFLVHQSGTNVTDAIRWSCHFRYNNLRERTFVDRGFPHPYIYRPQEELITAGFPDRGQLTSVFDE